MLIIMRVKDIPAGRVARLCRRSGPHPEKVGERLGVWERGWGSGERGWESGRAASERRLPVCYVVMSLAGPSQAPTRPERAARRREFSGKIPISVALLQLLAHSSVGGLARFLVKLCTPLSGSVVILGKLSARDGEVAVT